MDRSWNVNDYQTHHLEAIEGREFVLRVRSPESNQVLQFKYAKLMEAIAEALSWRKKALWARIVDFEARPLISSRLMVQLWAADSGCYGAPSAQTLFVIRGPVINPNDLWEYESANLLGAIDYATYWLNDTFDEPYWVNIRAPGGRMVMGREALKRLYHAEITASGGMLMEYIMKPSDKVVALADGAVFLLPEIVSQRQLA